MLTIKRQKDNRVVKCIGARIADIPGGVTVSVAELGGSGLFEGTPMGVGSDGLYHVCKTAQVVSAATATATAYEVAKGHHFKVGDYIAVETNKGQAITAIDKSNSAKDIITVGTTLGAKIVAGACAFQSDGSSTNLLVTPIGVAGNNEDVDAESNLFEPIWLIATVHATTAPIANDVIKAALKGIVYY